MHANEIVLPITKPETEWVRGRALTKMSPTRNHGRVQNELAYAITTWSRGRGEVAPEWRFRIALPSGILRPLVPDIAFVSTDRLFGLSEEELQTPAFAPTVAVEVLSPGDHALDVADKVAAYLDGGSLLVIAVDPNSRTVSLYDSERTQHLDVDGVLRHHAMPGFELVLGPFFALALDLLT